MTIMPIDPASIPSGNPSILSGATPSWDPMSIANFGISPMSVPDTSGMTPTTTAMGAVPNFGGGPTGLGLNMPTFNLALGGLQTLGGLWAAMQAAGVAKQQLNFTKQVTNANLANQTKAYNTSLQDRITSRGVAEGLSPAAVQDYIAKNSLTTPHIG